MSETDSAGSFFRRYPLPRFKLPWLVIGWVLVAWVTYGSLASFKGAMMVNFGDKVVHAGTYFFLMAWFSGVYRPRHYVWIALALFLLGVGLEIAQGFTRHRQFEYGDMAANGVGIVVALAAAMLGLRYWCGMLESYWARWLAKLKS